MGYHFQIGNRFFVYRSCHSCFNRVFCTGLNQVSVDLLVLFIINMEIICAMQCCFLREKNYHASVTQVPLWQNIAKFKLNIADAKVLNFLGWLHGHAYNMHIINELSFWIRLPLECICKDICLLAQTSANLQEAILFTWKWFLCRAVVVPHFFPMSPRFPCNNHTHQLPMRAGHCPWGITPRYCILD